MSVDPRDSYGECAACTAEVFEPQPCAACVACGDEDARFCRDCLVTCRECKRAVCFDHLVAVCTDPALLREFGHHDLCLDCAARADAPNPVPRYSRTASA